MLGEGEPADTALPARLSELLAAGRRGAAVERFLTAIGLPPRMIAPAVAPLEPIAHTLVYDCEISNATTLELLRSVRRRRWC